MSAPFAEFRTVVKPAWVDHNGHMGIRSYTRVLDRAIGAFYRHMGLTHAAIRAAGGTIFALQESAWYRREVLLGDPLLVVSRLIDVDHNKLITFHTLRQARNDYVAAMAEIVEIHIDRETRKPTPFPLAMRTRLAAVMAEHAALPRPPESGQGIAIRRKQA
ncbi:MAG: thioesterase [Alphaproteobacteria bacterium]|nr:thioesterase [Alphaproteobacteria bacterium]